MAKYILIEKDIIVKQKNKHGEIKVLAEKEVTEERRKTFTEKGGDRVIKPATQEDLKYFYEELKMTKYIRKIDSVEDMSGIGTTKPK